MASRKTTIGFRLKSARTMRGYTLRQVANEIGIAPIQLSQYERDIRKPNIDNLIDLAVFYCVMVDELLLDLKQDRVRVIHGSPGNPYGEYYAQIKNRSP